MALHNLHQQCLPPSTVGTNGVVDGTNDYDQDYAIFQQHTYLIQSLEDHYSGSLVMMRITGCARLVCLCQCIPQYLKLIADQDTDPVYEVISIIKHELE